MVYGRRQQEAVLSVQPGVVGGAVSPRKNVTGPQVFYAIHAGDSAALLDSLDVCLKSPLSDAGEHDLRSLGGRYGLVCFDVLAKVLFPFHQAVSLGLMLGIWRELYNEDVPVRLAYSPDWAETARGEPLLEALRARCDTLERARMRPGDILAFRWQAGAAAKHLALLAPANRIIHAYEGHAVTALAFVPSWRRRVAGVYAFPEN